MSDTLALLALMKKDEGLTEEQVNQVIDNKNLQPKLTAGENITISADNVISATDTGLTQEQVNTLIDSKNLQPKLTAGDNITIQGNTISASGVEVIDHNITQSELLSMPSKLFRIPVDKSITLNLFSQEIGSAEEISLGDSILYWNSELKILEDLVFNKEYAWLGEAPENPREYFVVNSTVEVANGLIDTDGIILLDGAAIDAQINVMINSRNLQPKLIAGTNITIDSNNVISSTDTGVNEERVNQLIDTKLGVIENGSY